MIGQKGIPATFGGIEYHVQELSRALTALGHDVRVYTRSWYSPPGSVGPPGVRTIRVPTIHTKHLDAAVHSALCAAHAAVGDADVLHFHALGPNLFAPIPRILGKKIVTTIHRLDWAAEKWGGPARQVLKVGEILSARIPHAGIVVSKDLRDFFFRKYGRMMTFIPQGAFIPVLRPAKLIREKYGLCGKDYILFMGRLSPEKRVDWILRAMNSLRAREGGLKGVRLVIAGGTSATDSYVDGLKRIAASHPDIVFTGNVMGAEKEELLTNALLFVLPSSLEGLPIVLMEARNYGLGCLASDIPPHREVIRNEEDGLLFRAESFPDLAEKLAGLLQDRPRIEQLGSRASKRMLENPSWRDVAARTVEIYRGVFRAGRL